MLPTASNYKRALFGDEKLLVMGQKKNAISQSQIPALHCALMFSFHVLLTLHHPELLHLVNMAPCDPNIYSSLCKLDV